MSTHTIATHVTRRAVALLTFAVAAASACAPRGGSDGVNASAGMAGATDRTVEAIELERGPCYGRCPVYGVRVSQPGTVRFDGRQHVADSGVHEIGLDEATTTALLARVALAPFDTTERAYVEGSAGCGPWVTDAPSVVLRRTLRVERSTTNGDTVVSQVVRLDTGCTGAPRWITELAAEIDRAADTDRWITSRTENR
jgi:hypothetical protein